MSGHAVELEQHSALALRQDRSGLAGPEAAYLVESGEVGVEFFDMVRGPRAARTQRSGTAAPLVYGT